MTSNTSAVSITPWLPRAAGVRPDRVAVAAPGGALRYGELAAAAARGAGALAAAGVGPGDRVALALDPGLDWVVALHACLWRGAVAVPVDPRLAPAERAARRRACALALDAPLPGGDPLAPHVPAPDEVALGLFTSGTTGPGTPVDLTHGNVQAAALGSAVALGLHPDERWLCPLPLAHVGGLLILLRSAIYATEVRLHPRFDAAAAVRALAEEGVTLVSVVPTMLARMLDAGLRDPPHLRRALLGGGPVPPALLARAQAAGVPVVPTYGMTQACSQLTTAVPGDPTAGWPLPGVQVAIAPDGEILARGATIAPGALAPDGWLHTGDLGALDARGRLVVTGRRADTIVSGGENVAPSEVEAVLLAHPDVADAGVHGRPDPEWGEAVVAQVVARPGAELDPDALRAWAGERLARFQVPKAIRLVDDLPRTPSGKLRRGELHGRP
jgi:O-succinylbenzoic acid--CoA ligase